MRGAGASLGVVTEFTFGLHEVGPTVHGGLIAWPFERAHEIAAAYRALTAAAPRELAVWMIFVRAPAAPFVPPRVARRAGRARWPSATAATARSEALAPLRALGEPVFDLLQRPAVHRGPVATSTAPSRRATTTTGGPSTRTTSATRCWRGWIALGGECPIPAAQLGILHIGGAINDLDEDDGAVGNRDARYAFGVIGAWEPDEPQADAFGQLGA